MGSTCTRLANHTGLNETPRRRHVYHFNGLHPGYFAVSPLGKRTTNWHALGLPIAHLFWLYDFSCRPVYALGAYLERLGHGGVFSAATANYAPALKATATQWTKPLAKLNQAKPSTIFKPM